MRISWRNTRWRRAWLVVPLVLVVAAASGAWLMTRDSSAAVAPTTAVVTSGTMKETVSATGTVQPARTADLDFASSGTVDSVLVAEGDKVRAGQALATVGAAALRANRTAAAAMLAAAYAQLDDDQSSGASDIQLAADQAAIVAGQATLADARQGVENATLRSTITGTVAALDLGVGDVVGSSAPSSSAGTGASTGASTTATSAVTVVSSRRYVVEATVSSADVSRLKPGLQAEITPTGVTDPVYGTVESVGLVAETSASGAAAFPVTIAVTGTRKDLYAGITAAASITVKQVPDVLSVPSRALQTDGDTTYVTEIVGGRSVKTTVETGTTYGMSTEITSGLAEGDEVEIPSFVRPTGTGGAGTGTVQQGGFPRGGPPGGGGFGGGTGQLPGAGQ